MSMSDHKAKDAAMASYMKQHPGAFPDSAMRPWGGNGSDHRAMANAMGAVPNHTTKWDSGMLAGILAARLGYGNANIPAEFLR